VDLEVLLPPTPPLIGDMLILMIVMKRKTNKKAMNLHETSYLFDLPLKDRGRHKFLGHWIVEPTPHSNFGNIRMQAVTGADRREWPCMVSICTLSDRDSCIMPILRYYNLTSFPFEFPVSAEASYFARTVAFLGEYAVGISGGRCQ